MSIDKWLEEWIFVFANQMLTYLYQTLAHKPTFEIKIDKSLTNQIAQLEIL